jgi:chromosome partitioning protein
MRVLLKGVSVTRVGALAKPRKPVPETATDPGDPVAANVAKWLVIASGKGGTTKTTTSLNLATIAAAEGLRVGILDSDEQETLTKWYERRKKHDGVPGLRLFSIPLVDIKRAIREIDETEDLDLVIVDTPPGLEQRARISELIRRADYVLVPTSQSTADIDSALEFMAATAALGVPSAFLLSRTNQRWGSYRLAKKLLNRAGMLCPVDVRQLRDIEATHDYGLGINELGGAKGGDDLEAVWEFVRQAMGI